MANKPVKKDATRFEQPGVGGNSWNDTTNRFAMDHLLRSQGFKIEQRQAGKPSVWSRGGRTYLYNVAVSLLPKEAARDVALSEAMHEYEWED